MRKRLSFANVASGMALVVALGILVTGTAITAGSKVPGKNGVKSSDIAPKAVKGSDVGDDAIGDSDIADAVLTPISNTGQCQPVTSGAYYPPTATIDAQGFVHLQGAVATCTGTLLANLPAQFRPKSTLELLAFDGGGTDLQGAITIVPNGNITDVVGGFGGIHHFESVVYKP